MKFSEKLCMIPIKRFVMKLFTKHWFTNSTFYGYENLIVTLYVILVIVIWCNLKKLQAYLFQDYTKLQQLEWQMIWFQCPHLNLIASAARGDIFAVCNLKTLKLLLLWCTGGKEREGELVGASRLRTQYRGCTILQEHHTSSIHIKYRIVVSSNARY